MNCPGCGVEATNVGAPGVGRCTHCGESWAIQPPLVDESVRVVIEGRVRNLGPLPTLKQAGLDPPPAVLPHTPEEPFYIVFDGPPAHESGRFIEVETKDGRGLGAGQWEQMPDGRWRLGPFKNA